MELVASLPSLENIVGLVGIDHTKSPSVLPSQSSQLASIVFRSFVAEASNVVPGAWVDGDATKIINGVGMPKDNIPISIGVLLPAVHSVAVAVNERKIPALVNPAD